MSRAYFDNLAEKWPSTVVCRSEIGKFSGGILTPRYVANLDSAGRGISGRIRVGRKICYPVQNVIRFLEKRAQEVDCENS